MIIDIRLEDKEVEAILKLLYEHNIALAEVIKEQIWQHIEELR